MRVLFLDDSDKRWAEFRDKLATRFADLTVMRVATAPACLNELWRAPWDVVFLDHDLGGEEYCQTTRDDTGSEVARQMAKWPWPHAKPSYVVSHSHYDEGADNIGRILANVGIVVIRAPFRCQAYWKVVASLQPGCGWITGELFEAYPPTS